LAAFFWFESQLYGCMPVRIHHKSIKFIVGDGSQFAAYSADEKLSDPALYRKDAIRRCRQAQTIILSAKIFLPASAGTYFANARSCRFNQDNGILCRN
jgi:hypothetical protein